MPEQTEHQNGWRDLLTTSNIFAFAMLLLIITMVVISYSRKPSPPLAYTQVEYLTDRSRIESGRTIPGVYNPGETLTYTASLEVKQDGALEVVRGFRTDPGFARAQLCDGTTAKNIVPAPEDQPSPFPPAAVNNNVEGRIAVLIPDLKPGLYWLTSSVYKVATGGEAVTTVKFRVTRACPNVGG